MNAALVIALALLFVPLAMVSAPNGQTSEAQRGRRRRLLGGLGWGVAILLALLSAGLLLERSRVLHERAGVAGVPHGAAGLSQEAVSLMVQPHARVIRLRPQPGVKGTALVVIGADGRAVVATQDLPAAPGRDYELWALPADGNPIAAGFARARAGALLVGGFDPAAVAKAVALAVSLEPQGGSPNGKPSEVVFIGDLNG